MKNEEPTKGNSPQLGLWGRVLSSYWLSLTMKLHSQAIGVYLKKHLKGLIVKIRTCSGLEGILIQKTNRNSGGTIKLMRRVLHSHEFKSWRNRTTKSANRGCRRAYFHMYNRSLRQQWTQHIRPSWVRENRNCLKWIAGWAKVIVKCMPGMTLFWTQWEGQNLTMKPDFLKAVDKLIPTYFNWYIIN